MHQTKLFLLYVIDDMRANEQDWWSPVTKQKMTVICPSSMDQYEYNEFWKRHRRVLFHRLFDTALITK